MNRNLTGILTFVILLFISTFISTGVYGEYVERPYEAKQKGKTRLGTVYFPAGSYQLTKDGLMHIKKIAHMLEIYSTYDSNRRIRIIGYADHEGDSEFNLHLGLARAEQLARALDEYGVSMESAIIASYGESKSLYSENNYRRAEVWLEPYEWGLYSKKTGLYMFFAVAGALLIGYIVYWSAQKQN